MTDGLVLPPGAGRAIEASGMMLKIGGEQSRNWSLFEANVPPGFDVGAHLHDDAEELFYILDGELDLLAFRPRGMADAAVGSPAGEAAGTAAGESGAGEPAVAGLQGAGDWRSWESQAGATVVRGGPGSAMFVPAGCPHAFANPGPAPVRMIFLVTPPGHEHYLEELAELIRRPGPPDQAEIAALRARHDIRQLTPLVPGRPG